MITEDTVSVATQASWLFEIGDNAWNRRRHRSAEPGRAVSFQFERVYDMVASEAIVLCDFRGRNLRGVGDSQLCRMLAQSVPTIYGGSALRDVQLKAMDLIRPNIDWSNIAIRPIKVPNRTQKLFVASVSESRFNQAGVLHAGNGVRRILGIPSHWRKHHQRIVSSRDRLSWDVVKALKLGFHDFNASPLATDLRVPRWFSARKSAYVQALGVMLERVDDRLEREGLCVDRPRLRDRLLSRGQTAMEGYRTHRFELPVRRQVTGRQLGTLTVEMVVYNRHFNIPQPPNGVLYLV